MTETRLEHFLRSVGYPDRNADGLSPFTMRVDGMEIVAEESNGRIVLSCGISDDPSLVPSFASYAAGRMLHEDAVLAFGRTSAHPEGEVFLWQDAPADAGDHALVRLFETFADSCEWWRARAEKRDKGDAGEISEAVIRP